VGDAIVQEPEQYAEGFNQKVAQAADFLMEDYEKTQGDWEAIRRSTQNIGEHIKEKADKVRNIAQEKLAEMKAKEQDVAQAEDRVKTIDTTAEPVQTTTDLPEKKTPELPESHE
jgi:flagellar motility protein MotE (MotC chaperone)